MVSVTRKFDSLDTPANRFVKYALHKFDSICVDLVQSLQVEGQNMQAECIDEAKAIHNIIEDILKRTFLVKLEYLVLCLKTIRYYKSERGILKFLRHML